MFPIVGLLEEIIKEGKEEDNERDRIVPRYIASV
jgi:hypothetical protein